MTNKANLNEAETRAEFIQQLYGYLPELFRSEAALREIWSNPNTRAKLLEGLAEKGYEEEKPTEIGQMINAEKSDFFDILAYIAFALAPISRV